MVEENWEFDTFKGPRPSSQHLNDDLAMKFPYDDADLPQNSTIRPPNTSKVPSSLRALFQEEDMPPESFSAPAIFPLSLSPGNNVTPPMSTSPGDRTVMKKGMLSENSGDESEQPGFAFPPRPSQIRSNSKPPGGDFDSDGEKVRNEASTDTKEKLPPLGPGIPFGKRLEHPSDARDKLPPLGPGIPLGKARADHSSEAREKLPPLGPGIPFGKARNELRSETREKLPPLGAGIPMGHGVSLGFDEKSSSPQAPRSFPVRSANKISFGEMDLDALKIRNEPVSDTKDKSTSFDPVISSGTGDKSQPVYIAPANSSLSVSTGSAASSPSRSHSRSPPVDIPTQSPNTMVKAESSNDKPFLPGIRSLDLGALMNSRDDTHAELARTVDELAQWLSVVETGLSDLLLSPAVDVIEEEQEDPGSHADSSQQPRGRLEGARDHVVVEDDILSDSMLSSLPFPSSN